MIFYTGIGARKTPPEILHKMEVLGSVFANLGYTLRSGAATGADSAFERGCDSANGSKEIYLPWPNFNNHSSHLDRVSPAALTLAESYYPYGWNSLSRGVKNLMARNMYQILGSTLDKPSRLVLCWTPDGARNKKERKRSTGGTGQAIALASDHDIPVFNLFNDNEEERLMNFLGEIDGQ